MPCTEFGSVEETSFILLTMNMLDVLDEVEMSPEQLRTCLKGISPEILADALERDLISKEQFDTATAYVAKKEAEAKQLKSEEAAGRKDQGNIGERIMAEVAVERLNLTAVPFDTRTHGFDGVFVDGKQIIVVTESKHTEKQGSSARSTSTKGDRQLDVSSIERIAKGMMTPGSRYYSETNAQRGREILDAGAENVRAILLTTDPQTGIISSFERKGENWVQIDRFDTREGDEKLD